MNLEDVHLRTTRALQPVATTVPNGTLCFITDEGVIEQSNGAAWVSYSSASTGLNQLTGDVTAGPGSGSQVATITNGAIVTAKIADAQVTEAKQVLVDNTTQDVSITKHGYAPKLPNDATKYLNGVGAWAVPAGGGGSDWDQVKTKTADQDVINSTVLVDCTDLLIPVLAGETWIFELLLKYSAGGVSQDCTVAFGVSAGNLTGTYQGFGFNISDAATHQTIAAIGLATTAASMAFGTSAVLGTPRIGRAFAQFTFSADANFTYKFAQQSAGVGIATRVWAGSILRGKKIG